MLEPTSALPDLGVVFHAQRAEDQRFVPAGILRVPRPTFATRLHQCRVEEAGTTKICNVTCYQVNLLDLPLMASLP